MRATDRKCATRSDKLPPNKGSGEWNWRKRLWSCCCCCCAHNRSIDTQTMNKVRLKVNCQKSTNFTRHAICDLHARC